MLPDYLGEGLDLVFVGINPGIRSEATGHHYAGPGNHFWPLLHESGLVSERHFRDGEALYENLSEHHDHCICNSCGKIIEFENEKIEELQEAVARKFGFQLLTHKMELYGICAECRKASES